MFPLKLLSPGGYFPSKGTQVRPYSNLYFAAMVVIVCVFTPSTLYGYRTQIHAAGETIEWELNPIPPGRVNDLNIPGADCYENRCLYVLVDPSWSTEYTLSAKISTPLHTGDLRELSIYYYSTSSTLPRVLESKACGYFSTPCTITPAVSIASLPDDAASFEIHYSVNGGSLVIITINIAYMDGRSAAMYGGPGENEDTFFCADSPQPGRPKRVSLNRKKGAGPGG